jgi:hypothetical protein
VVAVTGFIDREQERHRAIPWLQGVAGVTETVVRTLVVQRWPSALSRDLSILGGCVLAIISLAQRQKRKEVMESERNIRLAYTPPRN